MNTSLLFHLLLLSLSLLPPFIVYSIFSTFSYFSLFIIIRIHRFNASFNLICDTIGKLLHVAVSDVSDDVRRAAVTCLGFLLFRTPDVVPQLVSLLAESFNPHVR